MSFAIGLTDEQWELVADLFDPPGHRGAPAQIPRQEMVEARLGHNHLNRPPFGPRVQAPLVAIHSPHPGHAFRTPIGDLRRGQAPRASGSSRRR